MAAAAGGGARAAAGYYNNQGYTGAYSGRNATMDLLSIIVIVAFAVGVVTVGLSYCVIALFRKYVLKIPDPPESFVMEKKIKCRSGGLWWRWPWPGFLDVVASQVLSPVSHWELYRFTRSAKFIPPHWLLHAFFPIGWCNPYCIGTLKKILDSSSFTKWCNQIKHKVWQCKCDRVFLPRLAFDLFLFSYKSQTRTDMVVSPQATTWCCSTCPGMSPPTSSAAPRLRATRRNTWETLLPGTPAPSVLTGLMILDEKVHLNLLRSLIN